MRLLVVEDNADLGSMIAQHFRERGATTCVSRSGAEALAQLQATVHDAMILDLGLPDMDGLALLRRVRQASGSAPPTLTLPIPILPVLILTAHDRVDHRIAGLDAGADDYVLKPFDIHELDARLRAVLRRPGPRAPDPPGPGELAFDAARRTVGLDGRHLDLTPREAVLFAALLAATNSIVVRDFLADRLFGLDGEVSPNALEAVVSRMRRKLVALGSDVRIETLRGVGYRLSRPVAH